MTPSTTFAPSSSSGWARTLTSDPISSPELKALAARLGRTFNDPGLLPASMAHRSWCAEAPGNISNERLEFLGDAVLGLVVTDHLYRNYPDLLEGEMAKVRASIVSAATLAEVAGELDLGSALLLGKGEDASGGREKPSILADAIEAVIAAVYLDGGWPAASELILRLLGDRIAEASTGPGGQDHKTRLQELAARHLDAMPTYDVVDEGPDHAKHFRAVVRLDERLLGRGEGRSKKQAEQAAARDACDALRAEIGLHDSPLSSAAGQES
ncbi:MAG: ribonuclease III [Acidimicrobiales bacterium]